MSKRNSWPNTLPQWFLALLACLAMTEGARAQSPVKMKNYDLSISEFDSGEAVFELAGVASHLGVFTARGDCIFVPGSVPGSKIGLGVVVFEAANGDRLVGVAIWNLAPLRPDATLDAEVQFSWRESVVMADGTIMRNTGRFARSRPPGAINQLGLACTKRCFPVLGCVTNYIPSER